MQATFPWKGVAVASVVLVSGALLVLPAWSQTLYGSIVGTVLDATGAVVPNAQVSATNVSTNQVIETTTDQSGRYQFLNVQPGTYDIKVTAQGFRTLSQSGIDVAANIVARSDIRLEVGQVSEQVTVAASAVLLQTEKSDVHTEIGTTAITNLPLSRYRNYQSLIDLVPGATPTRTQNSQTDTPGRSLT
jgi:hypothetical protein